MRHSKLPTFTSRTQRLVGGVGFYSDDRDNNRLEEMGCTAPAHGETPLPGELRRWSVRAGKGQVWDLGRLAVVELCHHCGEEAMTNVVNLCAKCSSTVEHGMELVQPEQDVDHGTILSIAHRYQTGQISADEALQLAGELNGRAVRRPRA